MSNLLALVPLVLVEVAFVVVVALLSRGRIRVLGVAAGVLWLVNSLLNALAIPFLFTELDLPSSTIGLVSALFGLLHWAGLVLVAVALVLGGRAEAARRGGGEPGSAGSAAPGQRWGQPYPGQGPRAWDQPPSGQQPPHQP